MQHIGPDEILLLNILKVYLMVTMHIIELFRLGVQAIMYKHLCGPIPHNSALQSTRNLEGNHDAFVTTAEPRVDNLERFDLAESQCFCSECSHSSGESTRIFNSFVFLGKIIEDGMKTLKDDLFFDVCDKNCKEGRSHISALGL